MDCGWTKTGVCSHAAWEGTSVRRCERGGPSSFIPDALNTPDPDFCVQIEEVPEGLGKLSNLQVSQSVPIWPYEGTWICGNRRGPSW